MCRICCLLLTWLVLFGVFWRGADTLPAPPAQEGENICVSGTVYRQEFTETSQRIYLKDISIHLTAEGSPPETIDWEKKRVIVYLKEYQEADIGNRVLVFGVCSYPQEQRNPGCFDARAYYHSMGVWMFLRRASILQKDSSVYFIRNAVSRFRGFCREQLVRAGEDADAGILSAMLLGDKGILDAEVKDLYQDAGIIHLLAISGLHISLTGMALYRLLRKTGLSFSLAGLLAGGVMSAYACMTGGAVSAVRAVMMFLLFLLSQATGRTYDLPTSLLASAAVIVAGKNNAVSQAGFLLSFGAVAGVLLAGTWESRHLRGTALGVSISVQFATLPAVAYFYYQIPLYAVVLNPGILWMMPFILGFGIAGMGAAALSVTAGKFLLAPAHYLLAAIELICRKVRMLPWATVVTGRPALWKIIAYYILLLAFLSLFQKSEKKLLNFDFLSKIQKIDLIKLPIASILLIGVLCPEPKNGLAMTFLDVGQGDGCCIENENRSVWMVDGGSSSETDLAAYTLEPFLKSRGIGAVDYWLISHFDQDHISGLLQILRSYEPGADLGNHAGITVREILLPCAGEGSEAELELRALAAELGIPVRNVGKGDLVTDGRMTVKLLSPARGASYENSNAASAVAQIRYRSFCALMTGDVEGAGEEALLEDGLLEDVDVLKAAHHGSMHSTPLEFLRRVAPEVTVISCKTGNSYGHPHAELLKRLEECESRVARTDLQGAVEVLVPENGAGYTVTGYIKEQKNREGLK